MVTLRNTLILTIYCLSIALLIVGCNTSESCQVIGLTERNGDFTTVLTYKVDNNGKLLSVKKEELNTTTEGYEHSQGQITSNGQIPLFNTDDSGRIVNYQWESISKDVYEYNFSYHQDGRIKTSEVLRYVTQPRTLLFSKVEFTYSYANGNITRIKEESTMGPEASTVGFGDDWIINHNLSYLESNQVQISTKNVINVNNAVITREIPGLPPALGVHSAGKLPTKLVQRIKSERVGYPSVTKVYKYYMQKDNHQIDSMDISHNSPEVKLTRSLKFKYDCK